MAKVGDKFKIEIAEVFKGDSGIKLYRMKGFNTLVFDQKGIDRLEPLVTPEEIVFDHIGSKLCVGDSVIVIGGKSQGEILFTNSMKRFVGQRCRIESIRSACGFPVIRLRNDEEMTYCGVYGFTWVGDWLVKVE